MYVKPTRPVGPENLQNHPPTSDTPQPTGVASDMWYLTCDVWYMTCDMWRVTCDSPACEEEWPGCCPPSRGLGPTSYPAQRPALTDTRRSLAGKAARGERGARALHCCLRLEAEIVRDWTGTGNGSSVPKPLTSIQKKCNSVQWVHRTEGFNS